MREALWVGGLCLIIVGCSSTHDANQGPDGGGDGGGATATGGTSLAGTWDLMTTPVGDTSAVPTTVTIGQDTLAVTAPSFTLNATHTGNALAFVDEADPGGPSSNTTLTATQMPASFSAGILPFDLSGSWTMTIVPSGGTTVMTCTLTVSSTEIDGACEKVTDDGFDFSFTTTKMTSASSSLGDFGGTWLNTWIWPGADGGVESDPCMLEFTGNTITTCPGQVVDQDIQGSPITGITFAYDGANTVSGAAQGWAEYSATRR
jgi:hypothetical protein